MPKKWEDLIKKIKGSLSGKINPKTKKPYSEEDIYAIAMAQWMKTHKSGPKRESLSKILRILFKL